MPSDAKVTMQVPHELHDSRRVEAGTTCASDGGEDAARLGGTVNGPEVVLYAALTLAMAILALSRAGGPFLHALAQDSYQYLSVAENLRHEGSAATSIVHFDSERAHGRMPAPVTTFPPGYPALIWLFSWTGLAPEVIGVVISLASTVAVVLLLLHAGRVLGLTALGQRLTMFVWAFSAQASLYGSYVLTEALFTALSTAGIVLLLPRQREDGAGARTIVASILLGLGYWVRYAGLFFVVPLNLYSVWRILRERNRRWAWGVGLVVCDGIVATGLARNLVISGTWRGGNTRASVHSVWITARNLAESEASLVLGSLTSRPIFLASAVLVLIGGAATAVAWARAMRLRRERSPLRVTVELLLLWITTYTVAMFCAGLTTDVSFGARLLFPTLPLLILLLGTAATIAAQTTRAWTRSHRVLGAAFLASFAVGYVGANVDVIVHPQRVSPHALVARTLALPTADGGAPLSAWIESNVSRGAVLLAARGQATGYLLKRNTVSLVSRYFSDISWDEEETHRVATQFGASYVLIYRGTSSTQPLGPNDRVVAESPFLRRLAADQPPGWLQLAASNRDALVYRVRP